MMAKDFHYSAMSPNRDKPIHNLPLPTFEEYVGREQERAQLHKLLSPESSERIIVIRGIGGIGKSALALEIGYSYIYRASLPISDQGFDAVIWISVGTSQVVPFSTAPLIREFRTLHDLLSAVALTFGVEGALDMGIERLKRIVQDMFTNYRTLLIVDNLEESVSLDVLEFISKLPTQTKVLVTTRYAILDGKDFPLQGLLIQDAREFAKAEIVNRNLSLSNNQMDRLVHSVSYIPMAILFALGQIQDGLQYEAVLAQLATTETNIAEDMLGKMLTRLEKTNAYSVLLAASLFSKDVSREALGAATSIHDAEVLDRALGRLVSLSLLQEQAGRFLMLPIVRRWLQRILGTQPEVEEGFWNNLTNYYSAFASTSRSETESQTEVESVIDVAMSQMQRDNWETARQLLEPFGSIAATEQYLDMAKQMALTGRETLDMYVAYATIEDMPRVCELENTGFEEGVASPPEKMMSIFYKDPTAFLVLKTRTGEIAGYASLWPVAAELIDDLLSRKRDYNQIKLEEVRRMDYGKSQSTDYWLDTIMVTDPKYNIVGASLLLRALQKRLVNPIRIVSVAVTPFGSTLMRKLGMRVVWQTDEPVGEDINYCGLIDTRDLTQDSVVTRLVRK